MTRFPMRASRSHTSTRPAPRNWPSSMPMTCASCAWRSTSLAFFTARDGMRISLCETMASFA